MPIARPRLRHVVLALTSGLFLITTPAAQAQAPTPAPEPNGTEAAVAPDAPVAIPLSAVVVRASALGSFLKSLESSLEAPASQVEIAEAMATRGKAIRRRAAEMQGLLERRYDRAELDVAKSTWRGIASELDGWETTLAQRLEALDAQRAERSKREKVWKLTAEVARDEKAPRELRELIAASSSSLKDADRALRTSRDEALGLQRDVVALESRATEILDEIQSARDEVLEHVLRRNRPPVWKFEASDYEANRESFFAALDEGRSSLQSYAASRSQRLLLHAILIALLIAAAIRARRSFGASEELRDRRLPPALTHPFSAALVLGLTTTVYLHPDAPPHLGQVATVIVLPFWFPVLRSLLPDSLRGPVIGFLLLVPLELARQLAVSFELLARGMLLLEAALYFGGIFWLRRPKRLGAVPPTDAPFWLRLLGWWLGFSLFASGVAVLGGIAGWTTLADLAITTVARGSFAASILFTAVRVAEDVCEGAARSRQLRSIRTIDRAPDRFLRIVQHLGRAVAFLTWVYLLLDNLAIRTALFQRLEAILATPFGYGNVSINLGGLIAFGIAIWISWTFSRFLAAVLEGDVFSRVTMPRGVPFALTAISRYAILVLGFVTAIAALGVEVGNLALLVSALGVGIGFGMQNVVNNFISGLILLFERPIKVGDVVSLDTLLGEVKRIGIRASVVRTFEGADVIVPNGDLLATQLTNWTLADTRRRIILPVGVVYGTPAPRVIDLLVRVAQENEDVLEDPSPTGLFVGFGDSSLDFELRAWTESSDALTVVRSNLAVAVQAALDEAGIEVPFPQRDLHLKTLPAPHTTVVPPPGAHEEPRSDDDETPPASS